jgi:hypothetical protein
MQLLKSIMFGMLLGRDCKQSKDRLRDKKCLNDVRARLIKM